MSKSLATKQFISAFLAIAVFGVYGLLGLPYDLGSVLEPGPGLVPRVVAIVGFLMGLWMLMQAVWNPGDTTYEKWTPPETIRAIGFPLSILVATILTSYLGHITSLALMVAFDAWLMGIRRWTQLLVLGLGAGMVIWIVFANLLDAGLIRGPLGF